MNSQGLCRQRYISCRNSAAGKLMCFPLFHCGLLFYWKFVESIAHLHNISVSKMLFLFGRMFWLKNPNCIKQVYLGLRNIAWALYICGDIKAEEATSFFISAKVIFSKSQPLEKAMASRHFRSNSSVVGVFPTENLHQHTTLDHSNSSCAEGWKWSFGSLCLLNHFFSPSQLLTIS